MAIDRYLDKIDDILEEAWDLPFTGGKRMIDIDKVRDAVDDIRMHIPQEIKDAKAIVADREEIIKAARSEADMLAKKAEDKARLMISHEAVLKTAQEQAKELLTEARAKSKETEKATIEYCETLLKKCEETIASTLAQVKETRAELRKKTTKKK